MVSSDAERENHCTLLPADFHFLLCRDFRYIGFVLIFITILSLQLNVGRAFTVCAALERTLVPVVVPL